MISLYMYYVLSFVLVEHSVYVYIYTHTYIMYFYKFEKNDIIGTLLSQHPIGIPNIARVHGALYGAW